MRRLTTLLTLATALATVGAAHAQTPDKNRTRHLEATHHHVSEDWDEAEFEAAMEDFEVQMEAFGREMEGLGVHLGDHLAHLGVAIAGSVGEALAEVDWDEIFDEEFERSLEHVVETSIHGSLEASLQALDAIDWDDIQYSHHHRRELNEADLKTLERELERKLREVERELEALSRKLERGTR